MKELSPVIEAWEHKTITLEEFDFNAAQRKNFPFVNEWLPADLSFKLSYFIGIDWLTSEKAIYVEPKLNETDVQIDYLSMVFKALQHPELFSHTSGLLEIKWDSRPICIHQEKDLLTPLLVVQFLSYVKSIVRKGLKKSYYKVQNNLHGKIKGKVLISQTLKQNIFKSKTLNTVCQYEEYGLNNLENRLIKKTLTFIKRYLSQNKILISGNYIDETLAFVHTAFEEVSEDVHIHEIKSYRNSSFYKEYDETIKLSRLILRKFGYNIVNVAAEQHVETPPFWIDMSKLFELYVCTQLMDRYSGKVSYLYGTNFGETYYGQPDFLLSNEYPAIIDAKYKTRYKPANLYFNEYLIKDIRQIAGYARDKKILNRLGFTESQFNTIIPKCLIIYPDQTVSENLMENIESPIDQFCEFYKLPVKLPNITRR